MEEAKQIAEWLDALDRPNKQMLRAAVDGLVAALPNSPETGKNLQDLLRDSQRKNRWPIAYILAHLPQPPNDSLEILVDTLDLPDPDVRWAIILLLARLTKAQESILQLTTSVIATGTATQRRMVIYYLKELKRRNEAVRQALLGALNDPDPMVRVAAVISLKDQDVDSTGKTTLLNLLLRDPDFRVQHAAAITLASLGSPSEEFLSALNQATKSAQEPLKKAALSAQRILQEKKEVRPIRQLTSPVGRTSS